MKRLSNQPLPPYTYVPGKTAHPVRDPRGHSFGSPEPSVESFVPARWDECEAYRFGIDLFNQGFYWEAHEQWEAVWHAVGRKGDVASFLKGLIKLAAAGVKQLEGSEIGVQRHTDRAIELFSCIDSGASCGLDCAELIELARRMQLDSDGSSTPRLSPTLRGSDSD